VSDETMTDDVWPSLMAWTARRETEDPASLTFLDDRIGEMPEAARPTREEKESLDDKLRRALAPISDADWIVVIDQLPGGRRVFAAPRSASLARVWPVVFYDWQRSRDLARMAARHRLQKEATEGDAKAEEPHAENVLCAAVARRLDPLLDVVGREPDGSKIGRAHV